jgi:hypothetical protein
MRCRIVLSLLLLTVLVSPSGGSVDGLTFPQVDPFHGWWKLERCTVWDDNGHGSVVSLEGCRSIRFDKNRIISKIEIEGITIREIDKFFRLGDPKNFTAGQIDVSSKGGGGTVLARFRFSGERLLLCNTGTDGSVRPNGCGPGKNHVLHEYVPFQPNRLFQSHPVPPTATKPNQ